MNDQGSNDGHRACVNPLPGEGRISEVAPRQAYGETVTAAVAPGSHAGGPAPSNAISNLHRLGKWYPTTKI